MPNEYSTCKSVCGQTVFPRRGGPPPGTLLGLLYIFEFAVSLSHGCLRRGLPTKRAFVQNAPSTVVATQIGIVRKHRCARRHRVAHLRPIVFLARSSQHAAPRVGGDASQKNTPPSPPRPMVADACVAQRREAHHRSYALIILWLVATRTERS